ncbi:MAG: DNA polymerase III subunit delta [Candidatus Gracilibacteria bacterium]|jgi:DNA polymerase-3 subunit delta|nr:DNA polymerase III subunit delta [Candidatus Gracilibacteria bacterium]
MKNIFLIQGENGHKRKTALQKIISDFPEADLEKIKASNLDISNFITDIRTIPFLSEKRLIVLENFFRNNEEDNELEPENPYEEKSLNPVEILLPIMENLPDFIILVFIEEKPLDKRLKQTKNILKIAEAIDCTSLDEKSAPLWLKNYISESKIKVAPGFEKDFLTYINSFDEFKIKNELSKLLAYADGSPLTSEIVKTLIPEPLSITIFNFTDAISKKNAKNAVKFVNDLVNKGTEIFYIFSMIVRQFRILIQVKELHQKGMNEFEIGKKISLHPYPVKLAIPQTKNFTFENLKEIYAELLEIEISTKSGNIKTSINDSSELTLAIEKLIINFCKI